MADPPLPQADGRAPIIGGPGRAKNPVPFPAGLRGLSWRDRGEARPPLILHRRANTHRPRHAPALGLRAWRPVAPRCVANRLQRRSFSHVALYFGQDSPGENGSSRCSSFRPRLESLEDRCLMSAGTLDPTFGNGAGYVTTSLSSGSDAASPYSSSPMARSWRRGGESNHCQDYSGGPGPLQPGRQPGYFVRHWRRGARSANMPLTCPMAALYPTTGTANDGKIVLASISTNFSVARYNPNGTLDTSFGTNGIATANFGSTLGTWAARGLSSSPTARSTWSDQQQQQDSRTGPLQRGREPGHHVRPRWPGYYRPFERRGDRIYQTLLLQPNGGLIVTHRPSRRPVSRFLTGTGRLQRGRQPEQLFRHGRLRQDAPIAQLAMAPRGDESPPCTQRREPPTTAKSSWSGRGYTPADVGILVRRYNTNGTLDSTFGNGGSCSPPPSSESWHPAGHPTGRQSGFRGERHQRRGPGPLQHGWQPGQLPSVPAGSSPRPSIRRSQGDSPGLQPDGDIVVAGVATLSAPSTTSR